MCVCVCGGKPAFSLKIGDFHWKGEGGDRILLKNNENSAQSLLYPLYTNIQNFFFCEGQAPDGACRELKFLSRKPIKTYISM